MPLEVLRARLLRSSFSATFATGLTLIFGSAFSFFGAPTDLDRDARLLGTDFSVTFLGDVTFLTLLDLDLRVSLLVIFAGDFLRADLGATGFATLFATEALTGYVLAGDLA